jgi:Na+/H+ antiporter NhaC
MDSHASSPDRLRFVGGAAGLLAPLAVFLGGVAYLGLAGAPDERGFWPVLLAAIATGLVLCKDREAYAEAVLAGMSQRIVLLMVMAWLLAGVLGSLVGASGFIEALVSMSGRLGVEGGAYVGVSFLIAAVVSTAIGTSLGTVILCAPLLYPAGGTLGADPVLLIAAILGGATFGDNVSPVSDTTIASASTQGADLGGVVRSRMKYAIPAGLVALFAFVLMGTASTARGGAPIDGGALRPLLMALGPGVALFLLLRKKHLVEGLMFGILATVLIGLFSGLIAPNELLYLDRENFIARGLLLDGMERGVGVSIFTVLLMGVVGGLEAGGIMDRLHERLRTSTPSARMAEWWTFGAVSASVLLTTHSVVAILGVGEFVKETGEAAGVSPYRRANILDITVCTYPFLFPFFIPTILAASMTASGADFGMPRVSALDAGLFNFHSWALLVVLLVALVTGFGRSEGTK